MYYIRVKAARKIGLLRRLRQRFPSTVTLNIYLSCVRPTLEYACAAWGCLGKRDALCLECLQRSAARVIAKVSASDNLSSDLLLAGAGLEPLSLRQTVVLASTLYRLSSDPPKGPPRHRNDFQNWIAAAPRPSRCSILRSSVKNYLRVPRPRTELLRLCPFYRGVSLLNSIPTEARASLAALKSFIISSPDFCQLLTTACLVTSAVSPSLSLFSLSISLSSPSLFLSQPSSVFPSIFHYFISYIVILFLFPPHPLH